MPSKVKPETKSKPGLKSNEQPIYRVLFPVILSTDRKEYSPGSIVDLSHLTPEARKYFVDRGYFETADGEPENDITLKAIPCKNC